MNKFSYDKFYLLSLLDNFGTRENWQSTLVCSYVWVKENQFGKVV